MRNLRLILGWIFPALQAVLILLILAGIALIWMELHPTTGAAGEAWRVGGIHRSWPVAEAARTDMKAVSTGPFIKESAKHPRRHQESKRGN